MVRVRATIESVDGAMLTAKARDGATMKVKLADNAPVNEVVKASLADIKQFVRCRHRHAAARRQPKGRRCRIFPEAMRGVGEGHRPWDYEPNSTMTNATVDNEVTGVDGQTLTVKYKDGEQKIVVHADTTEITTFAKKSAADLKPGQKIFIPGAKKLPDGTLEAPNVAFGDYGVWRMKSVKALWEDDMRSMNLALAVRLCGACGDVCACAGAATVRCAARSTASTARR